MDLSIIIISFNTKKLLLECIESVQKNTKNISYEIIVVDNASTDGSAEAAGTTGAKVITNKKNVGFAAANNQALKVARGKYVLLLNSDTLIRDEVLSKMVDWMRKNPKVGIASCNLLNADGTVQGTGGYFPTLIRVFSWMIIQDIPFVDYFIRPFQPAHRKSFAKGLDFYTASRELDWVTGAFFMVRKEVIADIGLIDEEYYMYVEEVDFCYRAKMAGWKVWYVADWQITHYGGASAPTEFAVLSAFKGLKLFYRKFFPAWQYPILRLLLKVGALGRIVLFGILEGQESAKIYAKAFKAA